MKLPIHFSSLLVLVTLTQALVAGGCATMRAERDALEQYERTREEMARAARGDYQSSGFEEAEKKAPLEMGDLAPTKIKDTMARLTGYGPNAAQAEQLYKEGQALYEEALAFRQTDQLPESRKKFLAAAAKYEKAAKRLPKSSLSQNALYYAGEAYFFADHYMDANDTYERLLKEHPNSRHLDEVQKRRFAIAQYWLDTYRKEQPHFYEVNFTDETRPWNGLFGNAMRVFDRIRLDDPTGRLADDATMAMANAYFAEMKFGKADEYYTDLRKTFPSSEHQFNAHFLGLKSKLLSYEGPDYGGAVLDEAEKLIENIRKQFPIEAEQERDYLVKAWAEVRYRKAEREWLIAQYFDRKAEYGAAKFYYSNMLQEYSDTPFAQRTQERLAQIGGLPDVPPQRFEWLVDFFPREETVKPLIATDKPKTKKR